MSEKFEPMLTGEKPTALTPEVSRKLDNSRTRASRDEDDDRRVGPFRVLMWLLSLLVLAITWLLRIALIVAALGLVAWAIWRFLCQWLPEWLCGALETFWRFLWGLVDGAFDWLTGLTCGAFGVFCFAATPLPAPPPVEESVVCGEYEREAGGVCICEEDFFRDDDGLCKAESSFEPIIDPEPLPEPDPEPVAVITPPVYGVGWMTPRVGPNGPAAYWRYATTTLVGGADYLVSHKSQICAADMIAAVGAASADNETGRNNALAEARAIALRDRVRAMCGEDGGPDVWAVSLGGYRADEDRDVQRMPLLALIDASGDGAAPAREIERLLCDRDVWPTVVDLKRYAALEAENVCATGWNGRILY